MADYYTKFSLILHLPNEAAQKYALDLAQQAASINQGDEPTKPLPLSITGVLEDWQFETDPSDNTDLWLHSENGGIDAVCAFVQHLLQQFDPESHGTLEWSNDCSKPRVDAYGGGAAIITAKKIKHLNTGLWLHRMTARLGKH